MNALPQDRSRWLRLRIAILVLLLLIGFVAVARGSWDLGVTRSAELRSLAEEQYERRISVTAKRGAITDRHGEVLAEEVEVDSIYADSRLIKAPGAAAAALAPVLGEELAKLEKLLSSGKAFVWLRRRVTPDVAAAVKALALPGVHASRESKRFYPDKALAAHLLGFSGMDSNGLEGVELKFDDLLAGRRGGVQGVRDGRGKIVFADDLFGPSGVMGNSVELTIDRTLQYIAETELANTVRTFDAKSGHVVLMEPQTGEILAMASFPAYNPNALSDSNPDVRRDRAVLDVFEPGSTLKVFTLAAALNAGAVRPSDLIFCEYGRLEMFDTVLHDDHRDGNLTPGQCLKRSSNICFAKIALKLGKERLYNYMRRFGFGEKTFVDLPFEAAGVLHHYRKWYDVDAATIAFGQGIGVTNIQMATALSSIANGGVLMKPQLVRRIVGSNKETVQSFSPVERRRVVSRYTARLVADMMTAVTEEGGTGIEGALRGFLVAGKTGTAQKSVGGRGYHEDKWVASFIGFVPAEKPRLVITVIIDEPLIAHYGGLVAAPTLRRIADQSLRYLGVAPTKPEQTLADSKPRADDESASNDPHARTAAEDTFASGTQTIGAGQVGTPDMLGMTMKQAIDLLSERGLRPLLFGTGFAAEQIPRPGEPVELGGFVQVNFRPSADEKAVFEPKPEGADTASDIPHANPS